MCSFQVYDPDSLFERSNNFGFNFLNSKTLPLQQSSKKIVFKSWWTPYTSYDYSWADLVVCINSEIQNMPFPEYDKLAKENLNNDKLIHIINGIPINELNNHTPNRFYPYCYFFYIIKKVNQPISYDYSIERPFIFEALLGLNKNFRIKILEFLHKSGLISNTLASMYSLEGEKMDVYRSPELDKLEDSHFLFYRQKAIQSNQRHTTALTNKNLIGDHFWALASWIISEKIYQNSWFSIIAETQFN